MAAGGLLAANLLLRKPPPAPLWTEADLPPLPDPAANGWVRVQNDVARRVPPNLPAALKSLTAPSPASAAWGEVQRNKVAIAEQVAAPQSASWLPTIEAARASPRFADACPSRIDAACEELRFFSLHQLYELAVFDAALRGEWEDAFQRAAGLAALDVDYAATSRRALSGTIALKNCVRVVSLIDVLLSGYEAVESSQRIRVAGPTARTLDSLLGRISEDTLDLRRMVIGEYLFSLDGLDAIDRSPGALSPEAGRFGPLARVLFDRGETLRMLNDEYEPIAKYASAPHGPAPDVPGPHAQGPLWWLRNPTGKQALDTLRLPLASVIQRAAADRETCLLRRNVVRPRVAVVLGTP